MNDAWLYIFELMSCISMLFGCFLIIVSMVGRLDFGERCFLFFVGAVIFFLGYYGDTEYTDQINQIKSETQYEVLQEIPVEVIDNVDTITYKENDSTLKVLNLNEYFGRKFTDEVILVKRIKAGVYAGWKVDKGSYKIFEVKE